MTFKIRAFELLEPDNHLLYADPLPMHKRHLLGKLIPVEIKVVMLMKPYFVKQGKHALITPKG